MTSNRGDCWRRVVESNLTGTLFGLKVPVAAMIKQGGGQVWMTEGFGSDGATQPGMAAYGATKRAVRYLRKALLADTAGTPVQVGTLSPGIVVTDLLTGDYDPASEQWEKAKRIFNILGDRVETVTPWLAEHLLAADKPGSRILWLTRRKAFARFALAPSANATCSHKRLNPAAVRPNGTTGASTPPLHDAHNPAETATTTTSTHTARTRRGSLKPPHQPPTRRRPTLNRRHLSRDAVASDGREPSAAGPSGRGESRSGVAMFHSGWWRGWARWHRAGVASPGTAAGSNGPGL